MVESCIAVGMCARFNDRPSMQEECSGEGASAIANPALGFSYGCAMLARLDRRIDLLIVLLFAAGLHANSVC